MISGIKIWLTSVLTTVLFMVIVDMILPSNNIKKYAKFVTGLIVIVTILSPVFKLFNRETNIQESISRYAKEMDDYKSGVNINEVQKQMNKKTIDAFKDNLKKVIENSIYDETGKKYTVSRLDMVEDVSNMDFSNIKNIEIKKVYGDSDIKPVDTVVISEKKTDYGPADKKVLELLGSKFNIKSSSVKFVK